MLDKLNFRTVFFKLNSAEIIKFLILHYNPILNVNWLLNRTISGKEMFHILFSSIVLQ